LVEALMAYNTQGEWEEDEFDAQPWEQPQDAGGGGLEPFAPGPGYDPNADDVTFGEPEFYPNVSQKSGGGSSSSYPSLNPGEHEQEDLATLAGKNPGDIAAYIQALNAKQAQRFPGGMQGQQRMGGGPFGGGGRGGPGDAWGQDLFDMFRQQYGQSQDDRARRQAEEDNVRSTLMEMIRQGQQPLDPMTIANSPEARGYARLADRAQDRLRGQAAERSAQMGTGAVQAQGGGAQPVGAPAGAAVAGGFTRALGGGPVASGPVPSEGGPVSGQEPSAPPQGEGMRTGGALGSSIEGGQRQAAENIAGFQSQMMGRELQAKRQQLMQALQMGAGLLSADQQRDLQRELGTLDAAIRQQLGQGQLGLGYDQLGSQIGMNQANLNQQALMYLMGQGGY
jgi:hypothetical protein